MEHGEPGGAQEMRCRRRAERRLGAGAVDRSPLYPQRDAVSEEQANAGAAMDAVVGEAVGRAGAEVEQRVAAEHVDHESARMHRVDHEGRAADQRLECGGRAAR